MKLRWEDEVAPWQPPTDMTAPGALFNQKKHERTFSYQLYGLMNLYAGGYIGMTTVRASLFTDISGV